MQETTDDLTGILAAWMTSPPPCEILYINTGKTCQKPSAARVILLCPSACKCALYICGFHIREIGEGRIKCRTCGKFATGYLET